MTYTTTRSGASVDQSLDNADEALATANAALPKAGGTLTGSITIDNAGPETRLTILSDAGGFSTWVSETNGTTAFQQFSAAGAFEKTFGRFVRDGEAELYHNDIKRISTTATGIEVTGVGTFSGTLSVIKSGTAAGTIQARNDNGEARFQLDTAGDMVLSQGSPAGSYEGNFAKAVRNGGFLLYYDNSLKLQTTDAGVKIDGTYASLESTTSVNVTSVVQNSISRWQLQTQSTGNNGRFAIRGSDADGSNPKNGILLFRDGGVQLNYDAVKKFETKADGVEVSDAGGLQVRTAVFNSGAGIALVSETNTGNGTIQSLTGGGGFGWNCIKLDPANGRVELQEGNVTKFETVGSGARTVGKLQINHSSNGAHGLSMFDTGAQGSYGNAVTFGTSDGNTSRGSIQTADAQIPRFSAPSDVRLKANIVARLVAAAEANIMALQVRQYDQFAEISQQGASVPRVGFIADELEIVYPGAVTLTDPEDPTSIKMASQSAHNLDLLIVVQSLVNRVNTLEGLH